MSQPTHCQPPAADGGNRHVAKSWQDRSFLSRLFTFILNIKGKLKRQSLKFPRVNVKTGLFVLQLLFNFLLNVNVKHLFYQNGLYFEISRGNTDDTENNMLLAYQSPIT